MKLKLMFAVSSILNIALIIIVTTDQKSRSKYDQHDIAVSMPYDGSPTSVHKTGQYNGASNVFHWAQIESTDYLKYVANLRAIGCPEETVKDIIIAEVEKRFEGQKLKLEPMSSRSYWRKETRAEREAALRRKWELAKWELEKKQMIAAILGYDAYQTAGDGQEKYANILGFLSSQKRNKVEDILDLYKIREDLIRAQSGSVPSEADRKKLAELHIERDRELSKVLDAEELNQYRMRTSPAAAQLKHSIAAFRPSEGEFKVVFDATQAVNRRISELQGANIPEADRSALIAAARKELEQTLREGLGGDRFAEYELSQRPDYRDLVLLKDESEDAVETAKAIIQIQDDAIAAAKALKSKEHAAGQVGGDDAARNAILMEAENAIRTLLGNEAYTEYSRRNGGWRNSVKTGGVTVSPTRPPQQSPSTSF